MSPAPDGPASTVDGRAFPAGGPAGRGTRLARPAPPARTALAGLSAAALGVGAGQALALLIAPAAGPVNAVAEQVVALTPPALAGAATVGAGIGSRHTVVAGVLVVLALAAAGLGALSRRSPWPGAWGLAVLGLAGVVAAATASGAGQLDMVPAGAAAVVAVTVFRKLHGLAARIPAPTADGTLPDGRPVRSSLTRRRFLRTTALAGAGGVVLGTGAAAAAPLLPSGRIGPARDALTARIRMLAAQGRIAAAPALPAGAQVPGAAAFTTAVDDFYRIDTALRVPSVDPASWSLRVHGRVGRELTLTLDDLLARPLVERWVTMACVSNEVGGDLVSTTRFTGVELAPLLAAAEPDPAADQALSTSTDGWTAGSPSSLLLDPARGALLAVAMAGPDGPVALPPEHGFPVRIVVPGLYGYVSATKVGHRHRVHDVRRARRLLARPRVGPTRTDGDGRADRVARLVRERARRPGRGHGHRLGGPPGDPPGRGRCAGRRRVRVMGDRRARAGARRRGDLAAVARRAGPAAGRVHPGVPCHRRRRRRPDRRAPLPAAGGGDRLADPHGHRDLRAGGADLDPGGPLRAESCVTSGRQDCVTVVSWGTTWRSSHDERFLPVDHR